MKYTLEINTENSSKTIGNCFLEYDQELEDMLRSINKDLNKQVQQLRYNEEIYVLTRIYNQNHEIIDLIIKNIDQIKETNEKYRKYKHRRLEHRI